MSKFIKQREYKSSIKTNKLKHSGYIMRKSDIPEIYTIKVFIILVENHP